MNIELNKIFGRDFIIGFFLPALLFCVANLLLARILWPDACWLELNWRKPFEDTGVFILLTWGFAVFLQSVNREIFRTVEGYWPFNLQKMLNRSERKRFRKLKKRIDELHDKPGDLSGEEELKLERLSLRMASRYPSEEEQILPSSFGNAVRAYEDYPRVIYNFESINGWSRLQPLMSKDSREILSNDRARVDLWLNVCVLAVLYAVEVAIVVKVKEHSILWLIPLLLLLAWLAYLRARSSVQQFGEQVKAAFDIYLPALAGKLGYVLSPDIENNKKFWRAFSQVMAYRDSGALQEMADAGLERVRAVTPVTPSRDDEE